MSLHRRFASKLCTVDAQRPPTLIVIARVFASMTLVSDVDGTSNDEKKRGGEQTEAYPVLEGAISPCLRVFPHTCSWLISSVSQPDSERSNRRFVARFLSPLTPLPLVTEQDRLTGHTFFSATCVRLSSVGLSEIV